MTRKPHRPFKGRATRTGKPGQLRAVAAPSPRGAPTTRPGDADDPPTPDDALATFHVDQVQGCSVVVAAGDIDISTAGGLRKALDAATSMSARVVLDLTSVTFMDSSGVAVLVGALKQRRGHQASLCLVGAGPAVRRVLDITHVDRLLPTYDTLATAIKHSTWTT
jgi:anti-sigma B factor antagonist